MAVEDAVTTEPVGEFMLKGIRPKAPPKRAPVAPVGGSGAGERAEYLEYGT